MDPAPGPLPYCLAQLKAQIEVGDPALANENKVWTDSSQMLNIPISPLTQVTRPRAFLIPQFEEESF